MRVMAVDPGEKRIGVAISDPTGTIAKPLSVINHVSRAADAAVIAALAQENGVEWVVVGQALDEDGPGFRARQAQRLAEAIRMQSPLPVSMWDESSSTLTARQTRMEMGVKRNKRGGHLDSLAAAIILQDYLDANENKK
jgi:putative holliday junction resolvase